ncbi:hypothetical protein BX600DRAFT_204432 [Xylariales sp. PMI_506]|nr:hypothetical protein BX600DRAFT_204432 [Xylariales sp. PMI_506]
MKSSGSLWELLPNRPKSRRARHPKVSSGCATCRRRHIKCDEAQPACNRCTKSRRECSWVAKEPQRASTKQGLGPNQHSQRPQATLKARSTTKKVIADWSRLAPLSTFELNPCRLDPIDVSYFDIFRHHILSSLNGWCQTTGFGQYAIYEFMHDECVRSAVLALAAMARATQLPLKANSDSDPGKFKWIFTARDFISNDNLSTFDPPAHHHIVALAHYAKAITLCRQNLASSDLDTVAARPLLISTIAFIVLEILQGNIVGAGQLSSRALEFVQRYTELHGAERTPGIAELESMARHLSIKCSLFPYSDFRREMYLPTSLADLPGVPGNGSSFDVVRSVWETTSQRLKTFIYWLRLDLESTTPFLRVDLPRPAYYHINKAKESYLEHIRQWKAFINTMLKKLWETSIRQELLAIKVEILTANIFLEVGGDPQLWALHIEDCRKVAGVLETLAQDISGTHLSFMLEVQLIPHISLLALICTDRILRQHIVDLMAQIIAHSPRWHSIAILKGVQYLLDLDEQEREQNVSKPMLESFTWCGSEWDFEQKKMIISLQDFKGGAIKKVGITGVTGQGQTLLY